MDKAPATRPASNDEPKTTPEAQPKPFKLRSGLRAGYLWDRRLER